MEDIQNMQNMENMTWSPTTFVLLQHRNIGTVVRFNTRVRLRIDWEKMKHLAEPDVVYPIDIVGNVLYGNADGM